MSFDYAFAYEDRDEVHTSRWVLNGVRTTSAGNVTNGRLWMEAADSANTVTVNLFTDPACGDSDKVATGTADISGIADAAAKCTLAASNDSGLTGEFYFEGHTTDPTVAVEVLVSLAMDAELELEYENIADLPVYDDTTGMADFLAAATKKTLLLASQMDDQDYPDYRALSSHHQLREACVHWALMLAFGRCHERSHGTIYSELRDYHDQKRRDAIDSWDIALNTEMLTGMTESPDKPSRNERSSAAGGRPPSSCSPAGAPPDYARPLVDALIQALAESGFHLQQAGSYNLDDAKDDLARIIAGKTVDPAEVPRADRINGELLRQLDRARRQVVELDRGLRQIIDEKCKALDERWEANSALTEQRDALQALADDWMHKARTNDGKLFSELASENAFHWADCADRLKQVKQQRDGLLKACKFAKAHIKNGSQKKAMPILRAAIAAAELAKPTGSET